MNSPSSSWHPLSATRSWLDETLDRLADAVKDALLDWEWENDEWEGLPSPRDLPPVNEKEFLDVLRFQTEQTLRDVAATVNEIRPGVGWQRGQRLVAERLAELARDAFAVGLQMRLNAALRKPAVPQPAPGLWAARYRRMMLETSAFPETPCPDDDD